MKSNLVKSFAKSIRSYTAYFNRTEFHAIKKPRQEWWGF